MSEPTKEEERATMTGHVSDALDALASVRKILVGNPHGVAGHVITDETRQRLDHVESVEYGLRGLANRIVVQRW